MTIIQWNIRSYYNNLPELQLLIQQTSPSIICLQESHLLPKHKPTLKNFTIYRHDHTGGQIASGGIATFIRNDTYVSQQRLNTVSNIQHVTVQVHHPRFYTSPVTVCNIYIPPNYEPNLEEILELKHQLQHPYVLLGDLNAHSPL